MKFIYLCRENSTSNMKRIVFFALATLMLAACDNKEKFTVEGTVEGAKDSVLYFENVTLEGPVTLDSTKLGEDGKFRFYGDRPDAPEFYVLRIKDQIVNISIDSTETVTVHAQYPNMAARYEVDGSENCSKIRELALMQQDLHRQAIDIENNRQLLPQEARDSIIKLTEQYKELVKKNYIFSGPNMTYAYFALFQTLGQWLIFDPSANSNDMKVFAAVATSWDTFYPNTARTKNLHEIVMKSLKDQKIINARQQSNGSIVVETGVLDLNLTDNKGQQRTLTSLKGKVVLLDFHTFTMKESAQRILMLRELYNKYHAQGLEIYQVSVDQDEHFWRQMTVNLPWICVLDASAESAARYNVSSIPEYFLIDRENQLQQRGSQIKDLDAEIKSML
jgi:peroxiredoxin